MTTPIPSPPGLPLVGNLLQVARPQPGEAQLKPFERLADKYGPIYRLKLGSQERIAIANHELFAELCDETRFYKHAGLGLDNLNQTPGASEARGLFTSPSENDPDWEQAHRILMPAFGPLAIRNMFGEMHDIAGQLVLKWARLGSDYRIPVTDDFTRLTLDTIALCAMDFRFNSFYQDEMHPFVQAMVGVLSQGAARMTTPKLIQKLQVRKNEQVKVDARYQRDTAENLVKRRRDNPSSKADLLNAMVNGRDPKTGQGMRDELIAANMTTFLIAGHETTSGLLSFAFYYMLKNPATYFKAQKEVDTVVGEGSINVDHLRDLHYVEAIMRETLRLEPTAPAITRGVRPENNESPPTIGHGKYALKKNLPILCLLSKIQRDPAVYGPDAEEFRPERMLDESFNKLPNHAWKPFGSGMRACIGWAFAWQEALLVMAMLLQNFDFRADDPSYDLRIKSNLTIKPEGFYMRATLRRNLDASHLYERLSSTPGEAHPSTTAEQDTSRTEDTHIEESEKSLTVLYGSNTGTCQSFAHKLATDARARSFSAKAADMDSGTNALPTKGLVVIITASYEGLPPDNATQFVAWLESLEGGALNGVQYAVFGCGHKDWSSTFLRIPKVVDGKLRKLGAKPIVDLGVSDASRGDMFSDFDSWTAEKLWPAINAHLGFSTSSTMVPNKGISMEISTSTRATQLQHDVQQGKVLMSRCLTAPNEPEKRHLEVTLPEGMEYQAGDYLAVLPLNPEENVHRVLTEFSIPSDAVVTMKEGSSMATIPADRPVSVFDLLRGFVELSLPATRQDLRKCIEHTSDEHTLDTLHELSTSRYQSDILGKRISLLDILEVYGKISIPFAEYLGLLPPMRPRHYSISSSPLRDPKTCSITYGVINTDSMAGTSRFQGVAGNYLGSLRPHDAVQVSVRAAPPAFHLPASPSTTPIMMFCNGTGLAPFHGFCQERTMQLAANPHQKLAPALLFVGCRGPTADALYYDEFAEWVRNGVVDVRYAFSRDPDHHLALGCKYVQDRMLLDKDDVREMWRAGAKVYVCGSPDMVKGVKEVTRRLVEEKMGDVSQETVESFFRGMRNERIAVDVFA